MSSDEEPRNGRLVKQARTKTFKPPEEISPPIDSFVDNYYQSHFTAIADRVKTLINGKLIESHDARTGEGILASVTARAKTPESLRAKLQRKHELKPKDYENIELIKKNIKDLAGVRIALYTPSSENFDKAEKFISELFPQEDMQKCLKVHDARIHSRKQGGAGDNTHAEQGYKPTHLGYQGRHYRLHMQKTHLGDSYTQWKSGDMVEVQVTSAFGHAWAEVGHDIMYKTKDFGDPSNAEHVIYDAINGLATTGNLLLEQLHFHFARRTYTRFEKLHELEQYFYNLGYWKSDDATDQNSELKFFTRDWLDVLLRLLQKTDKNYPVAVSQLLKGLGYPNPEEIRIDQWLEQLEPSFENVEFAAGMKFGVVMMAHILESLFDAGQNYEDLRPKAFRYKLDQCPADRKCLVLAATLGFLQEIVGPRNGVNTYLKGIPMGTPVVKSLNWILEGKRPQELFDESREKDCADANRELEPAWEWFIEQSKNLNSVCGIVFKLAVIEAVPLIQLDDALSKIQTIGILSRQNSDELSRRGSPKDVSNALTRPSMMG